MSDVEATLRDLYLDLMQDILINDIYKDPPQKRTMVGRVLKGLGLGDRHAAGEAFDDDLRGQGRDWPSVAHSMIGRKRMANLRILCSDVIARGVPGDFIETGVWRGGACIYMRAILKAFGDTQRRVWVADSFEGLPPPKADTYAADKGDKHHLVPALAISLEQVQDNFRVYRLLDDQVRFLKGWFSQTLPGAPIERLALLRLDGDMYESTMDGLVNLYAKVSNGGYVIVDDYHAVPACRQAVHDFLTAQFPNETVEIHEIDGTGVYWQRRIA